MNQYGTSEMTVTRKNARDMEAFDRGAPEFKRHPYNLRPALEEFERKYLRNILVLTRWNITEAAGMLGICRKTLRRKMNKYELHPDTE